MGVTVDWDVAERPVSDDAVVSAVQAALSHGGCSAKELGVVFVGASSLTELHQRYLADESETDVITFNLGEGPELEGELYVSVDQARDVASRRGCRVERELVLYVVHGVLHLCGFDDRDEAARGRMRAAEGTVMRSLGYEEDELPHDAGT